MPFEHDGSEFTFELREDRLPQGPGPGVHSRRGRHRRGEAEESAVGRQEQGLDHSRLAGRERAAHDHAAGRGQLHGQQVDLHAGRSEAEPLDHGQRRGPVGISVGDVEVAEGADAALVFAVSLSRAASDALTIDYATSDGTATIVQFPDPRSPSRCPSVVSRSRSGDANRCPQRPPPPSFGLFATARADCYDT